MPTTFLTYARTNLPLAEQLKRELASQNTLPKSLCSPKKDVFHTGKRHTHPGETYFNFTMNRGSR